MLRKLDSTHMKSSALTLTPSWYFWRISALGLAFCCILPRISATEPEDRLSDNWIDKVELLPLINVIAYDSVAQNGVSTDRWSQQQLECSPARSLDDILRGSPRYSSFRRTSSQVAHPTTQGIQLRNIGGNAASRSLVLLDGIPQNDPFGGWVYWNRYHPATMEQITLTPSSRSSRYGSGALGGTIELETRDSRANAYELTGTGDSQASGEVSGFLRQNQQV